MYLSDSNGLRNRTDMQYFVFLQLGQPKLCSVVRRLEEEIGMLLEREIEEVVAKSDLSSR